MEIPAIYSPHISKDYNMFVFNKLHIEKLLLLL